MSVGTCSVLPKESLVRSNQLWTKHSLHINLVTDKIFRLSVGQRRSNQAFMYLCELFSPPIVYIYVNYWYLHKEF